MTPTMKPLGTEGQTIIKQVAKEFVNGKQITLVGGPLRLIKVTPETPRMANNLPSYLQHIANA